MRQVSRPLHCENQCHGEFAVSHFRAHHRCVSLVIFFSFHFHFHHHHFIHFTFIHFIFISFSFHFIFISFSFSSFYFIIISFMIISFAFFHFIFIFSFHFFFHSRPRCWTSTLTIFHDRWWRLPENDFYSRPEENHCFCTEAVFALIQFSEPLHAPSSPAHAVFTTVTKMYQEHPTTTLKETLAVPRGRRSFEVFIA